MNFCILNKVVNVWIREFQVTIFLSVQTCWDRVHAFRYRRYHCTKPYQVSFSLGFSNFEYRFLGKRINFQGNNSPILLFGLPCQFWAISYRPTLTGKNLLPKEQFFHLRRDPREVNRAMKNVLLYKKCIALQL